MTKKHKGRKRVTIGIFGLAALGVFAFFSATLFRPKAQKEDYKQIASSTYDTAFLAMYPIDTYKTEDFLTYRGMTVFKASYCIPDFGVMKQYMKHIAASENIVSTIYLGIRPDKVGIQKLKTLCAVYPTVNFEIILSYPSANYWSGLSETEYEKVLGTYLDFLSEAPDIPNANFYCVCSNEWLLANPDNYRDEWTVTEPIAQKIMLYSDFLHEYFVTAETSDYFSKQLQDVTWKIRTSLPDFPDLSDRCVVFFGDSVIGNYTDSTSIPGVVAGLTGAEVYNCGYGGNSAAVSSDCVIALAGIAEAFVRRDLSALPPDIQTYRGLSTYLLDHPEEINLCIVINYGLNDYFKGNPISSEGDPYDVTTFYGAFRTAVSAVRESYPDAQIILCTPPYCAYFQAGTEPHGEACYMLTDYVEAVLALAEELETSVLDVYHEFDVNQDNWAEYLIADQVHPNEAYRYLIGEELSRLMR